MTGIELIAAERQRQIEQEGWTAEHDDQHTHAELANAAIAYIVTNYFSTYHLVKNFWPWDSGWWKPDRKYTIRNLQKAGALIAAEIDRLQRHQLRRGGR